MAAVLDAWSPLMIPAPRAAMRTYTLKPTPTSPRAQLDYERALNPEQRAVVTAGAGPMLVLAGAGTGKTHTLTYRVAHLIAQGVKPERILLLTFTNKAARAMTERVKALLGDDVKGLWSGTFHSVAHRILRQSAPKLGYPQDFSIMDAEDCQTLLRTCLEDAPVDRERRLPLPRVLARIHSLCVNTQRSLERVLASDYPYFLDQAEDLRATLRLYETRKQQMALMDFDDLLWSWRRLLLEHPEELEAWSSRFEHILVDEYQDTNHVQGELVDLMASRHGNVMVVGDDCQSIYAFRGADHRNILEFPARYARCQTYRLELNYRSSAQILELANRAIARNARQFPKTLRATRPPGPRPALVTTRDAAQQAEFVCQRILELRDEGVPLDEIAVLYRSHYQSMELQVELTRRNIPYLVRSGMRFFEQAHIKDILAYLRVVYNPRDELSFMRLAQHWPHIGPKRAQQIWQQAQLQTDALAALCDPSGRALGLPARSLKGWAPAAALLGTLRKQRLVQTPDRMIEAILAGGYRDIAQRSFENAHHRISDLEQLGRYAAQYDDLDRFLGELSLLTSPTGQDILVGESSGQDEQLCLSSIHQAKGLEWTAVFTLWMADGHFPSQQALDAGQDELEEERRLFYVAATRAREDLYLCHPLTQQDRGRGPTLLRPSLFIAEQEASAQTQDEVPWERWDIEVG